MEQLAPRTSEEDGALRRRREQSAEARRRKVAARGKIEDNSGAWTPSLRSGAGAENNGDDENSSPEVAKSLTTIESMTVVTDPEGIDFSLSASQS